MCDARSGSCEVSTLNALRAFIRALYTVVTLYSHTTVILYYAAHTVVLKCSEFDSTVPLGTACGPGRMRSGSCCGWTLSSDSARIII